MVGAPLVFGATTDAGPADGAVGRTAGSARAIYRLSLPHVIGDPSAHSQPGHWTPHVTLGRRFSAAEIGAALAAVNTLQSLAADLPARFVGLRRWDGDERIDRVLV